MLDLGKVVYKRLEDGDYVIIPKQWELKPATGKGEDYVQVQAQLKGTDRIVNINLFEKGLSIVCANVSEYLNLGETTIADILDNMLAKELPAYHETVNIAGKTYYNWYVCSKPAPKTEEDGVPAF